MKQKGQFYSLFNGINSDYETNKQYDLQDAVMLNS